MIQACRELCKRNSTSRAAHAGLMLATQLRTRGDKDEGKRDLLEKTAVALKLSQEVYQAAWDRWRLATSGETFQEKTVAADQRLVVGLGTESVLETGLRLHYTYGTPLIPGSALKGLAAHYCHTVAGARHAEFKAEGLFEGKDGNPVCRAGKYYRMLFGTTESSGIITFHDAWITPESVGRGDGLVLDVITTHHPKYYSGAKGAAPHDGEDPIPLHFLSTRGDFRFVIEAKDASDDSRAWLAYTFDLLRHALASWGAGGKTSSGYGRFGR